MFANHRNQKAMEKLRREREEREKEEERVRRQREMYLKERRLQEAKLKEEEQRKTDELMAVRLKSMKKVLIDNWTGDLKAPSKPGYKMPDPKSSTYLLFAAKEAPKSEEKADTTSPKPKKESKQWVPNILKVGYWMDRYQDHHERKDEKRKQKAEEQYARWSTSKARRAGLVSLQNDFYTGGFAVNRNSILKSVL
ncbi:vicilin-like seed storage protein At2g18540 [Xyrichtys novacula]|uniref:Vicilin-like seed storage protein At2g18540 n=1 Tax=Xyrichtys novacula TaxID=13765 RepID=A0AAV1HQI0_XYRNO|nr:vicilin-like seed storage protein At2g18540 [Xyrichtys novacula]